MVSLFCDVHAMLVILTAFVINLVGEIFNQKPSDLMDSIFVLTLWHGCDRIYLSPLAARPGFLSLGWAFLSVSVVRRLFFIIP